VAQAHAATIATRILLSDPELELHLRVLGAHAEARGRGHHPVRGAEVKAARAGGAVRCARDSKGG
jgi:hypothetical protein